MSFVDYMIYRIVGVILFVVSIAWMITGLIKNGFLFTLGVLALIASTYFLGKKTEKTK